MITRALGASGRALTVVLLAAAPGLLIPGVPEESTQFATLIAIFAGFLTLIEYSSPTPVLVEFRHAPPYNKIRLLALSTLIAIMTLFMIGASSYSAFPSKVYDLGIWLGSFVDLPYSPVRLMVIMLPDSMPGQAVDLMRAATSLAFVSGLLIVATIFAYFMFLGWPGRRKAFNVHTNLPMFDPTSGGDVVVRLRRGARINVFVGLTVPFIIPACLQIFGHAIDATNFTNMQTLVWLIALWVFLPINLCLRGLVMGLLVDLIEEKRRQRYSEIREDGLLA